MNDQRVPYLMKEKAQMAEQPDQIPSVIDITAESFAMIIEMGKNPPPQSERMREAALRHAKRCQDRRGSGGDEQLPGQVSGNDAFKDFPDVFEHVSAEQMAKVYEEFRESGEVSGQPSRQWVIKHGASVGSHTADPPAVGDGKAADWSRYHGLLHIIPQTSWHDPAFIVGTQAALSALRDAIDRTLQSAETETVSTFANDGECYGVHVRCVTPEEMEDQPFGYTDEMCSRGEQAEWMVKAIRN